MAPVMPLLRIARWRRLPALLLLAVFAALALQGCATRVVWDAEPPPPIAPPVVHEAPNATVRLAGPTAERFTGIVLETADPVAGTYRVDYPPGLGAPERAPFLQASPIRLNILRDPSGGMTCLLYTDTEQVRLIPGPLDPATLQDQGRDCLLHISDSQPPTPRNRMWTVWRATATPFAVVADVVLVSAVIVVAAVILSYVPIGGISDNRPH